MSQPGADRPLFLNIYGTSTAIVPQAIMRLHDVTNSHTYFGKASVRWGKRRSCKLICRALKFPKPGQEIQLKLKMEATENGEDWSRWFGSDAMTSKLTNGKELDTVIETYKSFSAVSQIDADENGVSQHLTGFRFYGIPLPRFLWPTIKVRETAEGSKYQFDMAIWLPWSHLLVQYEGWLETGTSEMVDPAQNSLEPALDPDWQQENSTNVMVGT